MKRLGLFLLILLPLLIGGAVALPHVMTSDAMRFQFARQISSLSGMDISLNGPVSLSLFPTLGMAAENVSLAKPDGSLSTSVEKMSSGVKLSTLFSDKIEITGINLTKPVIELVQSADTVDKPASTDNSQGDLAGDPIQAAVDYLERLSLNSFRIVDGRFLTTGPDGVKSEISDINLELVAPDLDGRIEIDLSATTAGQTLKATGSLAALRPILENRPVRAEFGVDISPPPHPALANIEVAGDIQLVDQTYQIAKGTFKTLGQPLQMDVSYTPGERPYAYASLVADRVDLGAFTPDKDASASETGNGSVATGGQEIDLSPLRDMDGELILKVGSLVVDGVEARDIDMVAALKNGLLNVDMGNVTIADGQLALSIKGDANEQVPTVQGTVSGSSLGIANLASLAGVEVPANGRIGINLGYAFRGLSQEAIKKSLNVAGNIKLSGVDVALPNMQSLGPGAGELKNITLDAAIENIQKPINLSGQMGWKGDTIQFNGQVSPRQFVTDNRGNVVVAVNTSRVNATFDGDVALSGSASGKAKVTTGSLDKLLAWIGQGGDSGLNDFSFDGQIDASAEKFSFKDAKIRLNGIDGAGSGQVGLGGKTSITTNLSFGELDLAALTGSDAAGAKKAGGQGGGGASADAPLDLSALKALDAEINLSARKLGYGKVSAGPVTTTLSIRNGVAKLNIPATGFYGGMVKADVVADGSGAVPTIRLEADLAGVNALPLFSDAGDFERVEGLLSASLNTSGSGTTTGQFRRSLTGSAETRFLDGAIRGIDVAKIYNNMASVLSAGFKENASDKTEFTEMGLKLAIDKGVATTDDVKLIGPLVRMDGAGSVDLGEETINMRLNPKLVASIKGQGGDFDVSGVSIPVIVQGALDNPRVFPDLSAVLKNPQAALDMLSGIGLNIKGLNVDGLGDKLDISKLAKDKLNLDKLGEGGADKLKDVVGGLLNNGKSQGNNDNNQLGQVLDQLVKPKDGNNQGGDAGNLVGALLGNLTDQNRQNADPELVPQAEPDTQAPTQTEDTIQATGAIPIPQRNPLKVAGARTEPEPKQKTITEKVVEEVLPGVQLPEGDDKAGDALNNLLNKVLKN